MDFLHLWETGYVLIWYLSLLTGSLLLITPPVAVRFPDEKITKKMF